MSNLIPFSELPPQYAGLAVSEHMPLDRLVLDASSLGRVAGMGGLGRGVSVTSADGELAQVSASVAGFGGHNVGVAAAVKSASSSLAEHHLDEVDADDWFCHAPASAQIKLNATQLEDNVSRAGGLRKPDVWSRELSRAMGGALVRAAAENYLGHAKRGAAADMAVTASMTGVAMSHESMLLTVVSAYAVYMPVVNAVKLLAGLRARAPLHSCYSLAPGWHVDRVGLAWLMAKTSPIVKAVK